MAKTKKAPVVKSVIIEGAPVIERAIVRFSHIVLQFTVENGDQISYEVLETLENPEVADAIEYATVRFSEVVCQFVVTDGTTVHAYELEPVYQEIGGGPTPPEPPVVKYHWSSADGDFTVEHGSVSLDTHGLYISKIANSLQNRRCINLNEGSSKAYLQTTDNSNFTETDPPVYPIPVPSDAVKLTYSITPNTQFMGLHLMSYNPETQVYTDVISEGWRQGEYTVQFTSADNLYVALTTKYNSAGTSYPTDPTDIVLDFE